MSKPWYWLIATPLAAFACSDSARAAPPIGWKSHPFFDVVENATDNPEFHREFYRKGEGSAHWTERVVVASRQLAAGTTPADVLDAMLKEETAHCPEVRESRIPARAEEQAMSGLAMWHCPADISTHRGEVAVHRILVSANQVFIISAQGIYPSFEKGKSPLLKEQLDRWSEFQKSFALCVAWTVPGCMPEAQAIMTASPAELTSEEASAVSQAELRGRQIYEQDQIAWHGSDFAIAKKLLQGSKGEFIAEPGKRPSGHLYFVSRDEKYPGRVRVDLDETGMPSEGPREEVLPASVQSRLEALTTARTAKIKECTDRINTAVIPDDAGDGWLVYFLSATMKPGRILIGGHTRVHVDRSGRIVSTEYSANTCLAVDVDDAAVSVFRHDGAVTPVVTHLVSSVPWETQVFQSLTFEKDFLVVTGHAVWRVGRGKIIKLKLE